MQIIDDQEGPLAVPGEFGTNPSDDRLLVEVGRRGQLVAVAGRAGGLPDGGENGEPELLGVPLVAPYLDGCQPVWLT